MSVEQESAEAIRDHLAEHGRTERPSMTEELHRMVSQEARKQNGWEVLGIDSTSGTDGVIRFHRPNAPSGCHYGTAHFSTDGKAVVAFEWGHYDLSYRGGREDFSTRVAQGR
jgi:hypothetical protein